MDNMHLFTNDTLTKEAATEFILRMNCDEAIPEDEVNNIKEFYKEYYHDYYIDKIKNGDEDKAYDYYMDLLTMCVLKKYCFKNFLDVFIDGEVEYRERMRMAIDRDAYAAEIKSIFLKVIHGPAAARAMLKSGSGYLFEEMIKNSIAEANRFLKKNIAKLRKPFDDINFTAEEEGFIVEENLILNFTNDRVFTKLVNRKHGLSPMIEKGDIIFYTEEDKIIHLPFTRGLIIGHIKKLIINSKEIRSILKDLNDAAKYLSITNHDGEFDKKIKDAEGVIKFIEWALEHKAVIEYYDISKYMKIDKDDIGMFSAKLSDNKGQSFKNNISKLMNSTPQDIPIERLMDVSLLG